MEVVERISWDDYFVKIILATAERSSCNRLKVGSLIVKNNRIVSQGYNGFLSGCKHESIVRDGHEQATVHAEQNAISFCARNGVSCENSIIYITHYPCVNCMKLICASGIKEIRYINDYKNDDVVKRLSELSGINIIQLPVKE
jgi:dCMP deaminase